jgi:hypothetical protein
MKRTWSVLLGVLFMAASAAVQAQFTYTTNAMSITITKYSGPGGAVTIPPFTNNHHDVIIGADAFAGTPVTSVSILNKVISIGSNAFGSCLSLTSVTMSSDLASIGMDAFCDCTNLASITIPGSVTSLGSYAFEGCISLTSVTIPGGITGFGEGAFMDCTGLTNVTMSNGLASLGESAFEGCASLFNVTIPGSVTSIGESAFDHCTGLTNVTISGGVRSIGDNAFFACISLASVTIPASVTSIGDGVGVFGFCTVLTNITVDAQNSSFSSTNGVLFNKSQTTLMAYPGGLAGSYTIPGSVTNVASSAFLDCPYLTSLTIPGSVTGFGLNAIFDCPALAGVYFTGNAPAADFALAADGNMNIYYLPGATGWSNTFTVSKLPAVLWNPVIQTGDGSFGFSNGQFGFNITGTNDFTVVVEACINLANPVWIPITTNTLINGSLYFSEPAQVNSPDRFYALGLP